MVAVILWLRQLGLTLFPHACRRGRSIFQLGEAAPHPAWCRQLSRSLRVASPFPAWSWLYRIPAHPRQAAGGCCGAGLL